LKTERMTLLISPADKAAITARADGLGMSVSELVRKAALGYDPEEEAIEAMLPEVEAAIERMHASFDRMEANSVEHRKEMERLRSSEYREQVQREVWADPNIDWKWIAALREGVLHRPALKARAA
jgi:hypothetical protein